MLCANILAPQRAEMIQHFFPLEMLWGYEQACRYHFFLGAFLDTIFSFFAVLNLFAMVSVLE